MTKITAKGQVTIPKRLRDYLGLKPGSSVDRAGDRWTGVFAVAAAGAGEQICTPARERPTGHEYRRGDGSDQRRGRRLILVDTNVLLDLVTDDPRWAEWSQQQLALASAQDELVINEIVYAELSIGYERMEELDAMLVSAGLANAAIPCPALFLAGKAFQRYRSSGGRKTGVLPDFFIGAHAVVADAALITRDAARYRSYFPGIMLIAPS